MGVYGAFSPSVFGMLSQSQALNTIGINIANVSTGGYRARETRFSTLLSESMFNESDLNGVRPQEIQRIDKQGLLQASDSPYDLGIAGRGFFILSDTFDQSGRTFYGRDGSFQMRTVNDISVTADDGSTITVRDGYLADKNGYFVLGWEPDANGQFPTSGGTLDAPAHRPLRLFRSIRADHDGRSRRQPAGQRRCRRGGNLCGQRRRQQRRPADRDLQLHQGLDPQPVGT